LRLCASRGRNIITHCLLLLDLPNGDWTNEQVEIFVTADCPGGGLVRLRSQDIHAAGILHRDIKPENLLFTAAVC